MSDYKYKCVICGKDIITYKSNKRVCSWDCRKIKNKIHAQEYMKVKRALKKIEQKQELANVIA